MKRIIFIVLTLGFLFPSIEAANQIEQITCPYDIIFDQAIGYHIDENTGQYKMLNTHVAYRNSSVIAKNETSCYSSHMQEEASLTIGEKQYTPEETSKDQILFKIPHDDVKEGKITLAMNIGNIKKQRSIHTVDTKTFKLLLVPLKTNLDDEMDSLTMEDIDIALLKDEIEKRLPFGNDALSIYMHEGVNMKEDKYDLNTWLGRLRAWGELKNIREDLSFDVLIALVPKRMSFNHMKNAISGFTFGGFTTVICNEGINNAITITHEISHFYNVGDEYAGGQLNLMVNMPPYNMKGINFDNKTKIVKGTSPFVIGGKNDMEQGSGTLIRVNQYPYDSVKQTLVSHDMTSYMGKSGYSIDEYWTTPAIWKHLVEDWSEESE